MKAAGPGKVFREVASGAKTDRAQVRKVLAELDAGDVQMVTCLDRMVRSTRDPLNTLVAIIGRPDSARWATLGPTPRHSHGQLMLTVLGGLAEFERDCDLSQRAFRSTL